MVLQEDAQNTVSTHPDWVSYFIQDPKTHQWVHTTLFKVPAGSRINMTIYGYDGCTPLRNQYFGRVTGTIGNTEDVDGKPVSADQLVVGLQRRAHVLDPRHRPERADGDAVDPTANLCASSPCTSGPHKTMTFSFMTPKRAGDYFWQCRVPCGGGFIDGFGGPMQTFGFMTGNMEVVT